MATNTTASLLAMPRTALIARMLDLESAGHNLSNINTPGYRASRLNFQEVLSQTAVSGVRAVASQLSLAPGRLQTTGRNLDVAIDGDGFFAVRLPDGRTAYTRDGGFQRDAEGQLVTAQGLRLIWQGQLPPNTPDDAIEIRRDGTVAVRQNGTVVNVGRISLARFPNATALRGEGENLWFPTDASGQALTGNPANARFGELAGGALESSNVNMAEAMTHLIALQRAYSLSVRSFQQTDEMIGLAVQLRR